jgi:uncharacterized delta-60 repeat protein
MGLGRPALVPLVFLLLTATANPAAAAPGDLDPSFGGDGKVTTTFGVGPSFASGVAIQADGKIVAVGQALDPDQIYAPRFALIRYMPDGTLDPTFGDDGRVTTQFRLGASYATAVAIQGDGKIVAAGVDFHGGNFALARYRPNGTLDPTFGGDGRVTTDFGGRGAGAWAVAIQSNGKIVTAGGWSSGACGGDDGDFALARYRANGTLDATFGDHGRVTGGGCDINYLRAVAIQSDGKIVVGGGFQEAPCCTPPSSFTVARYRRDGTLDATFGGDGIVTTPLGSYTSGASDVAIQADGKIVAAGWDYGEALKGHFLLARYNADGMLDSTFSGDGHRTTHFLRGGAFARGVALQPDGKIVAVGETLRHGHRRFALARYDIDGRLDPTFSSNGKATTGFYVGATAWDVAIQADGKIVAAGSVGRRSHSRFALARYLGA